MANVAPTDDWGGPPFRRSLATCPCCAFLETDLFLPPQPPHPDESIRALSHGTSKDDKGIYNSGPASGNEEALAPLGPQQALLKLLEYAQRLHLQKQPANGHPQQLPLLLVDTHGHAHLEREQIAEYESDVDDHQRPTKSALPLVSLTCSVEPADWDAALQFAAATTTAENTTKTDPLQQQHQRDTTLMGLGVHPWYLDSLPDNYDEWLKSLEHLLQQHSSAVVGEIGLCKMAKCARNHPQGKSAGFDLQRKVFCDQLRLATQYRRPVSVHCVQQHGVLLELLEQQLKISQERDKRQEPEAQGQNSIHGLPPCVAMHSFTGTANHVKVLLQLEARIKGEEDPYDTRGKKWKRKQQKQQPKEGESTSPKSDDNNPSSGISNDVITTTTASPPIFYFGFSHYVNYAMCTSTKAQRQGIEAVRAVPLNRLLAESDLSASRDVRAGTAGAIAYLAHALNMPLEQVAEATARNGLRFLTSHLVVP